VFGIVGEERSIISCLMWVSAMLVWCQWRSDGELYICNSWGGNSQIRQRCDSWEAAGKEGTTERTPDVSVCQ
jgi:hypothetical protein